MLDIMATSQGPAGVRPLAPSGLTFASIEAAAWQLASSHCDTGDLPIDLEAILSGTGGRIEIYVDPIRMTTAPEIEVAGPADYLVHVPHYQARPRRRFLIAAGIGRYILHSGFHTMLVPDAGPSGDPEARMHWEACAFASALLLPRPTLEAYTQKAEDTVHAVAHAFDVTEQLVVYRLHALQTVAPNT